LGLGPLLLGGVLWRVGIFLGCNNPLFFAVSLAAGMLASGKGRAGGCMVL
jgi:hypothetical protein